MSRCPNSASRSSPPNASRGRRPAAWRDVVDALARALGRSCRRRDRRPGRRLPAALPLRAGSARSVVRTTTVACPGPARARRRGRRSRSSTSPADGYRLRLVDHPAGLRPRRLLRRRRRGDYADNAWRFGLFCRAALEALRAEDGPAGRRAPPPRLARRPRRAIPRPLATPTTRSIGRAAIVTDAPQPRLPRLDADASRCASSGLAPGDGVIAGRRRRRRPAAGRGSSGRSS